MTNFNEQNSNPDGEGNSEPNPWDVTLDDLPAATGADSGDYERNINKAVDTMIVNHYTRCSDVDVFAYDGDNFDRTHNERDVAQKRVENVVGELCDNNININSVPDRIKFFKSLTPDNLVGIIYMINSTLRGGVDNRRDTPSDINGNTQADGADDREQCLKSAAGEVIDYLNSSDEPDERKLDRAGMALGAATLWTHRFSDGNGRTHRFITSLVSRGTSDINGLTLSAMGLFKDESGKFNVPYFGAGTPEYGIMHNPRSFAHAYNQSRAEELIEEALAMYGKTRGDFPYAGEAEEFLGNKMGKNVHIGDELAGRTVSPFSKKNITKAKRINYNKGDWASSDLSWPEAMRLSIEPILYSDELYDALDAGRDPDPDAQDDAQIEAGIAAKEYFANK